MEINSWCYNYFLSPKWILRLLYINFSDLYRSDHYWKNKNDVDALTIKINVRIRCLYKHLILMMCEYGVHSHSDPRPHTVPLLQNASSTARHTFPLSKCRPYRPLHIYLLHLTINTGNEEQSSVLADPRVMYLLLLNNKVRPL